MEKKIVLYDGPLFKGDVISFYKTNKKFYALKKKITTHNSSFAVDSILESILSIRLIAILSCTQ